VCLTSRATSDCLIWNNACHLGSAHSNCVSLCSRAAAGKYVDIKDTISGFKGVLEGKYDDLPEVRRLLFSRSCSHAGPQAAPLIAVGRLVRKAAS